MLLIVLFGNIVWLVRALGDSHHNQLADIRRTEHGSIGSAYNSKFNISSTLCSNDCLVLKDSVKYYEMSKVDGRKRFCVCKKGFNP